MSESQSKSDRVLLFVVLTLPTLVTWLYFVALDGRPAAWQQGTYAVGKTVQFALPLVWVWLVLCERPRMERLNWRGVPLGVAFGLAVMGAMAGLYYLWLKPAGLFDRPMEEVREKVAGFGVKSAAAYFVLAAF